ncbi:MAG: hypothetical protein MJK12_12420 [Colwellia sp.]|nr:hypothetical protein [Colwellia sp.]
MPLLLIPLLAGGTGFGLGFFASDGFGKIVKVGLVLGGGYVAYQMYQGSKT